jgi:ribosomal-protein-alanine N-acetyltransferase
MISLKKLTSKDLDYFWTWGSDSKVTQNLFWDAYSSKEAAAKFLNEIAETHPYFKSICIDGKPIGAITIDQGKGRGIIRAELGYVLARNYWNKGITTKAVALAIENAFKELDILRIEAFVDPENMASIRVLEKVGFKKEGYLKNYLVHRGIIRDRIVYGITKN